MVRAACAGEWPQRVRQALGAILGTAAADPFRFQLLAGEPFSPAHTPLPSKATLVKRLAPRLRRGRRLAGSQLFPVLEEVLIGGVTSLVLARIRAGRAAELPELAPDLTVFLLTPYLGREHAERIAA